MSARWAGCLFAAFPAALAIYFLSHAARVAGGEGVRAVYPWVPAMGLELSFHLDGLGLLFALAITVVGTLIIAYAGSYLRGHPSLPRFYLFILMFMASMLGLVLSDNLIALFVFCHCSNSINNVLGLQTRLAPFIAHYLLHGNKVIC